MSVSRAAIASSFTIIKGPLLTETYKAFASWDLALSKRENLQRLKELNPIGTRSETWLRDVTFVVGRRFEPIARHRALVRLAQAGVPMALWRPVLLWHITRDEFLLRDFLVNWLFPSFELGVYSIRTNDVLPFLLTIASRGGVVEHEWTPSTQRHVAAGLLRMACDFGLLNGRAVRTFTPYHLPEEAFLYIGHAIHETAKSGRGVLESPEWRMFLMRPDDVERELLHLHQYRKLRYEVAGSLVELSLPFQTAADYAESLIHGQLANAPA